MFLTTTPLVFKRFSLNHGNLDGKNFVPNHERIYNRWRNQSGLMCKSVGAALGRSERNKCLAHLAYESWDGVPWKLLRSLLIFRHRAFLFPSGSIRTHSLLAPVTYHTALASFRRRIQCCWREEVPLFHVAVPKPRPCPHHHSSASPLLFWPDIPRIIPGLGSASRLSRPWSSSHADRQHVLLGEGLSTCWTSSVRCFSTRAC